MAKKKREVKKVIPITETKKDVRHVRVELPPEDYERVGEVRPLPVARSGQATDPGIDQSQARPVGDPQRAGACRTPPVRHFRPGPV